MIKVGDKVTLDFENIYNNSEITDGMANVIKDNETENMTYTVIDIDYTCCAPYILNNGHGTSFFENELIKEGAK